MEHSITEHVKTGWQQKKRPILLIGGGVLAAVILLCIGVYAYTSSYSDRIYPNVYIDSIDVGSLTQEEAYALVDQRVQSLLDEGVRIRVEGKTLSVPLRTAGSSDPDLINDFIYFEIDRAVDDAFAIARSERIWTNLQQQAQLLLGGGSKITPKVTVLETQLEDEIRNYLAENELLANEAPGEPTHYQASTDGSTFDIEVVEGTRGFAYDFDQLFEDLQENARALDVQELTLELTEQTVEVSEEEASTRIDDVQRILQNAPYIFKYTSQTEREYTWTVDSDEVIDWILPQWEGANLTLSASGDPVQVFIDDLRTTIDTEPQDARFQIEGDRVTEFIASKNGVTVNAEETIEKLEAIWTQDDLFVDHIAVVTEETQAEVTTDSVNNLGINEVLGVGISDFSGSPANRIANIKHGASKLDGLLLAPGETLSLVDALGPFTIADGYLPELVIKGDEIKPEVGGGLCQIGTTTFRATMNAGLEVVERRNHSLVVNYYNDPLNGNPGTDATIYDPAPDYKMRNDTDNYILLTTEVDVENAELIFTFWGTDDGREGYYTAPEVLSWSGYGETQYIETLDLAPGQMSCQSPHPGATTSFTYYVDYEGEEQHEKTYTSTYRSLPRICLVGVEALSCNPDTDDCEEAPEEEATDADSETGTTTEEDATPSEEDSLDTEEPEPSEPSES